MHQARAPASAASPHPPETGCDSLTRLVSDAFGERQKDISLAVTDLRTGQTLAHGQGSYETASIVKIDIAATLFLHAARTGRQVTQTELDSTTLMIEKSSNAAATRLWRAVGGSNGVNSANHDLGLTRSTAGPAGYWGLTRTDALDQLQLLRQVFGTGSALQPAARSAIRARMEAVDPGQRWGITAAGTNPALKNGWMQRTDTGRWNINSIGRISYAGGTYLIAVLTKDNPTKEDGIKVVEAAATSAVRAIAAPGCRGPG
ncbi:serine hydrolase [Streptomyces sp. NPDC051555]|uniref:serine hydrolase n=1 Tax=Streptomyces sp. NPDC051555 TaxID=3365657 RepID=UPI00378E2C5A